MRILFLAVSNDREARCHALANMGSSVSICPLMFVDTWKGSRDPVLKATVLDSCMYSPTTPTERVRIIGYIDPIIPHVYISIGNCIHLLA